MDRLKIYHAHLNIMLGVLEDDKEFLTAFYKKIATRMGLTVEVHETSEEFIRHLNADIHIAILDHFLDNLSRAQGITGLDIMEKVLQVNPYAYVIVVSAQPDMSVALKYNNGWEATNYRGAWKYVDKRGRTDDDVHKEVLRYVDVALDLIHHDIGFFSSIQSILTTTQTGIQTGTISDGTTDNDTAAGNMG